MHSAILHIFFFVFFFDNCAHAIFCLSLLKKKGVDKYRNRISTLRIQ